MKRLSDQLAESLHGCMCELRIYGGLPNVPSRPDLEHDQYHQGRITEVFNGDNKLWVYIQRTSNWDPKQEIWINYRGNCEVTIEGEVLVQISCPGEEPPNQSRPLVVLTAPDIYQLRIYERKSDLPSVPHSEKEEDLTVLLAQALSEG